MVRAILLLSIAIAYSPYVSAQPLGNIDWEAIEASGATIGTINYTIDDIFDLSNPEEDKRLYRLANRIHIKTRQSTLEDILLTQPGDPFEARLLEESARVLRGRGYIADAQIQPDSYDMATGTVDVDVHVRDAWSLSPDIKASRSGGQNEYGIGVAEENLLGLGKGLTLSFSSDVDRDERYFGYVDPNVRGTRTRLNLIIADRSDGHRNEMAVGRPFFALDSRWSIESAVGNEDRVDQMYGLGEVVDSFNNDSQFLSIQGGLSRGLINGRAIRWLAGFNHEENKFRRTAARPNPILLPQNRKIVFPWTGVQIIDDDYREMSELNDIGRTEDVQLGLDLRLLVGYSSDAFGADRDAVIFRANAHKGWEPGGGGRLLLFDLAAATRKEQIDGTRNTIVTSSFKYFHRNLGQHLFSASLLTTLGDRLDGDGQILLGGDSDLRGYPLRYQSGLRSAVLTLEQRFFTNWFPFRIIRVGYAVFFDVGRVWGADPRGTPNLGTLYDIGIGLRLTSPRSTGQSVVHIDLAFPINAPANIDSVQLSVERKRSF